MSRPPLPPEQRDGGGGPSPLARRQQEQPAHQDYTFSGRVLLTAVVVLAMLTVVFVLIRLIIYHLVVRGRAGGLVGGVRRSFGRRSSARHGLAASALAALPVTTYRADGGPSSASGCGAGTGTTSSSAADCAVCLSELADGEKVRALPGCGHVFHVDCVDAWLRSRTTCPVCRAEVRVRPKAAAADARPPPPPPPALIGAAGGTVVVAVEGAAAETGGLRSTGR